MYKQMFKTIVSMCIFYTVLLSVIVISAVSLISNKEMKASVESEMNYIESEFKSINAKSKIILDDVFSNEYVKEYINTGDRLAKYKFQRDLGMFADFESPEIKSIAVYCEGDKEVYSSNGTITLDYYTKGIGFTKEKFIAEINRIKSASIVRATDYFVSGNDFTMLTCSDSQFENPVCLMITFDVGETFSTFPGEGKEFFIFKDGEAVYGADSKRVKHAYSVADGKKSMLYHEDSFSMLISESNVPVKIVCISKNDMYVSLYMRMLLIAILFVAIVFMLGYIWSNRTTKRMYAPIKALLNNIKDMPDTVEDEFETIKGFIDELKSKNIYMQEYMQKNEDDKFLLSVLLNEFNEQNMKEYIARHSLDGVHLNVAMLEYTDFSSLYMSFTEEEMLLFKGMIKDILNDKFSAYKYYKVINVMPDSLVVVYSSEPYRDSFEDLMDVMDIIDRKFSVKLCVCVGEWVSSFVDLHKSYNDALYVLKCVNLRMDEGVIFTKQDISEKDNNGFIYPIDVEKALLLAALSFDMKTVKENIHFILKANTLGGEMSKECLIQLVTMFSATCTKILSEFNLSVEKVFGEDASVYLELRQANTFLELGEKIEETIEQIVKCAEKMYSKGFKSIKDSIEEYIEKNYQNDISLGDLARHLNLSETYVSKLFKSSIGKNFKEYLMYYKYIKAKQIMRENPTYKLKDVAQMVGCNTPLTLSRLLKKYEKEEM